MPKSRILVVDDVRTFSQVIRAILEGTKRFEVRVVNNSELAFNSAREFLPDLILLDVDMPGMDGTGVARQIRDDRILWGTPIIFVTSTIAPPAGGNRVTIGGDAYLAKPVRQTVLVEAVDEVLAMAA